VVAALMNNYSRQIMEFLLGFARYVVENEIFCAEMESELIGCLPFLRV